MKIGAVRNNFVACLVCLMAASLGTVRAAGWAGSGTPPVLPEVTTADAAFHPVAAASITSGGTQVAQAIGACSDSAPVLAPPSYGHHAIGYLALENPFGQPPGRASDDAPSVIGSLAVPNLVGRFGLFTAGQIQLRKGAPFSSNNYVDLGLSYSITKDLTAYTYAERRFNVNENRFVAGVRYNFDAGF